MNFYLKDKVSLKVFVIALSILTYFNWNYVKELRDNNIFALTMESLSKEYKDDENRYYSVLNKFEEEIERENVGETKKLYATSDEALPANIRLRNAIEMYGFYKLDKYENIHHIEINHFDILKNKNLLYRNCNWFELIPHMYTFNAQIANKYCSENYKRVADNLTLSKAINDELIDIDNARRDSKKVSYEIAMHNALINFIKLLFASFLFSIFLAFLAKKYFAIQ